MEKQDGKSDKSQVDYVEVARYYVKSELGQLWSRIGCSDESGINVENLPTSEVMELAEGLSVPYRLNSVWWLVANPTYRWSLQNVHASEIYLTGMGKSAVTDLIFSEEIQNDPLKLRDYLQNYFSEHQYDDPYGYGDLRPQPQRKVANPRLIAAWRDEKLKIVDGSHRFIALLLQGQDTFETYVGKPENEATGKFPIAGRGIFRMLKLTYEAAKSDVEQESVVNTVRLLAQHSPDAAKHIESTWVHKERSDKVAKAGRKIIDSLDEKDR